VTHDENNDDISIEKENVTLKHELKIEAFDKNTIILSQPLPADLISKLNDNINNNISVSL